MIHVILIGEMLHMMSQRQIQCNGNDTTFKTNFYNIVYSIAQPNRYFLHKLNDSNDKVQIKITRFLCAKYKTRCHQPKISASPSLQP
jgi:hypothetical protein